MKHSGVATEWLEPEERPEVLVKFGTDSERAMESSEIRSDLGTIQTLITVRSIERRAGLAPVAIIRFGQARWKRHLRLEAAPEKGKGYWSGDLSSTSGFST